MRLEVTDGGPQIQRILDEGFALEAKGWKGVAGTAVNANPPARRFYDDIAACAASAGALRLFALRLDGRVIAFHMTVEDQGVLHGIKRAYDESLRNYGPGLLLARSVLEHCFEDPRINRFDFSGEAEEHKTEWTDEAESQLQIEIFSPGVRTAASRAMVLSLWGAQEMVRRRFPVEIRERFDSSSPKAAVRSGAALIRTYVSACRTPSGRDRRSAEA